MASNTSLSTTRTTHSRHRRSHKSTGKFLVFLHSFNFLFSLLSISIFTAIIPVWNANFFHSTGMLRGDWPDALPILPLLITLGLSAYFLAKFMLAIRSSTRPVDYLKSRHTPDMMPHVSGLVFYLTLASLILLLTSLILAAISGLYRFWRPAVIASSVALSSGNPSSSVTLSTLSLRYIVRSISGTPSTDPSVTPPPGNPSAHNTAPIFHSCTLANVFTRRCNPTLYLLGDLQIVAVSSAGLVWLLNFVILILHVRERQHEKRRQQRSLRAKARSKLDLMEDELSRSEKGVSSKRKKIHHERKEGHLKSSSDTSLPATSNSGLTRPSRAYTVPHTASKDQQGLVRPKNHYYDPNITPSRLRGTQEPANACANDIHYVSPLFNKVLPINTKEKKIAEFRKPGQNAYSQAVEEARRKMKPTETMRDWLASRN